MIALQKQCQRQEEESARRSEEVAAEKTTGKKMEQKCKILQESLEQAVCEEKERQKATESLRKEIESLLSEESVTRATNASLNL